MSERDPITINGMNVACSRIFTVDNAEWFGFKYCGKEFLLSESELRHQENFVTRRGKLQGVD